MRQPHAIRVDIGYTRSEQRELQIIARSQRHADIRGGVDHSADVNALCLHDRREGGDFHRLADLADFHLRINARGLIQDQREGWLHGGLEPVLGDFDGVIAHGQAQDAVAARPIRLRRPHRSAVNVRGRDRSPLDGRSCGIGHRTDNCRGYLLAPRRHQRAEQSGQ